MPTPSERKKIARKIKKVSKEGKPKKQAIAIALDMNRRGLLK